MNTARNLLTEQRAVADTTQQYAITHILTSLTDVQTTVESLVATSNETHATRHTGSRDSATAQPRPSAQSQRDGSWLWA